MANRKQRRDTKKIMNRPELKSYVDKVCMDIASILVDHCEQESKKAQEEGKELKFETVEEKLRDAMNGKVSEITEKVKEIASKQSMQQVKVMAAPKINIR